MKISTILDHIDSGHMALPEFQRGYVWNRDRVRGMEELLHGNIQWLTGPPAAISAAAQVMGGVTSAEEEAELETLHAWVVGHRLPQGVVAYDFAYPETGQQQAVFDLAWPSGLQEQLSRPVAVLLNEEAATVAIAS